jgi:serine/threonine protein kinase/predicted ATPase
MQAHRSVCKAAKADRPLYWRRIVAPNIVRGVTLIRDNQELTRRLQSSLGASYKIEREVGGGGMSYVFVAEEAALGRKVALKVLRPDLAVEISTERFKREILLAARLQHPHIVPLLTAGDAGGLPYYTMPFVSGESLETRLKREGIMPVRETVRILSGVARALAYAHRFGVVHRDIKPGNVLIVEGTPMVTDFGIAKAIVTAKTTSAEQQPGGDPHADRLTAIGVSVGTPAYMSPEQIAADPMIDHRTDIYSFGVLAYEMLAGRRPFSGSSHQALLVAHLMHVAQPLHEIRAGLPSELVGLVTQCLRKEAADRPASADDLVIALDNLPSVDPTHESYEIGPSTEPAAFSGERIPSPSASSGSTVARQRIVVARETEAAELMESFETAASERGLLHAVVGEAGLGKTALVESFLRGVVRRGHGGRVSTGRCSERLAGTEAYLPILEALESLLAGADGAAVGREMRQLAPSWYLRVNPSSPSNPTGGGTSPDVRGGSSDQMKRQLGALLLELTRSGPLVLVLEDIHWADASTIDLISYLGDRFDTLRMLILVTYRPSDLQLSRHPFIDAKLNLEGRGAVRETHLPAFDREGIDVYLANAYPNHEFPREFVDLLHARTEGTPLFVVDLMRQLVHRGVVALRDDVWRLEQSVEAVESELPQSIRSVIQRTMDRLDKADRSLLVAASVQGTEFDSAVIADAIKMDSQEVEERLERLERVYSIVRLVDERVLARRTPSLRYRFAHILYQNTLHGTLRATRRTALSASVAEVMEQYYGSEPGYASELAVLYASARQFEKAATYFLTAARAATRVFASKEAIMLARRGLKALESLPDSIDRARLELQLNAALGVPLTDRLGYAAAEVEQVYSRARDLSSQVSDTPTLLSVLHGLYRFYIVRGQLHTARDIVQQLIKVAEETGDAKQIFIARAAMGPTLIHLGEFETAAEYLETGMAAYDPSRQLGDRLAYGAFMPGAWLAVAQWLMGRPDEALETNRIAREFAAKQQNPFAVAYGESLSAWLHQYRGDATMVKKHADAAIELARTHDFAQWRAIGTMLSAWSTAALGDPEAGRTMLTRGIEGFRRTGSELNLPHFLSLLADAHMRAGDPQAGLPVIEEALATAAKNDDRVWEPELHRLKGELLLRSGESTGDGGGGREASEAAFRSAIDVAVRQKSRSLELRAALSLARLLGGYNNHEAMTLLAAAVDHFPADSRSAELDEARAMIQPLDRPVAADL